MPDSESYLRFFGFVVVVAPAALLGVTSLLGRTLSERATHRATAWFIGAGLVSGVAVLALMLANDTPHVTLTLGDWAVLRRATTRSTTTRSSSCSTGCRGRWPCCR